MFCTNCGSEVSSEARFCGKCGTALVREDGVVASEPAASFPVASHLDGQPEPVTFATAMDAAKQKSKRRIPMVVLVALVLALATGVAYAAYRVYTDVYVPLQQAQRETQMQNAGGAVPENVEDSEIVSVWVVDDSVSNGKTYTCEYDEAGRVVREISDPYQTTVESTSGSQVKTCRDEITFSYGDFGLAHIDVLNGAFEETGYTEGGSTPYRSSIDFAYDDQGRCVSLTWKDYGTGDDYVRPSRLAFEYGDGDAPTGAVRYTYRATVGANEDLDSSGVLVPCGELSFGYDEAGRLISVSETAVGDYTYTGSNVSFTYDSAGNCVGATTSGFNGGARTFEYDFHGNLVSRVVNGERTEYSYKQVSVSADSYQPTTASNPTAYSVTSEIDFLLPYDINRIVSAEN
ncbi:MAG: zinc ribbon domain-containing protein [Eggerthellaceae bacterium]|nr:zinc ribbon domain-containing protein [Eggerthellaceae bacterium]